jgi:hypothetical protein
MFADFDGVSVGIPFAQRASWIGPAGNGRSSDSEQVGNLAVVQIFSGHFNE